MIKICDTPAASVVKTGLSLHGKIVEKALKGLTAKVHGFTLKEIKTVYEQDDDGSKRVKSETVTVKNVGPDLSAIVFVLTNLDGQRWKSKPGVTHDAGVYEDDELDLTTLSDEVLKMLVDSFPAANKSGIESGGAKDESI